MGLQNILQQFLLRKRRPWYNSQMVTVAINRSEPWDEAVATTICPVGWRKEKNARGSAQPIEKAQNGQENPRKSKLFSFGFSWIPFGRFGLAWKNLGFVWKTFADRQGSGYSNAIMLI